MDTKKWLVLFLLVAGTASAAMPARRDSLYIEAFRRLSIPVSGNALVTTATGASATNWAIVDVCNDFPAVQKLDTVVVGTSAQSWALNSDFVRLAQVYRYPGDTMMIPLESRPFDTLFQLRGGLTGLVPDYGNEAMPRYYWSFADRLYLLPLPLSTDTMYVGYYALGSWLAYDTSTTEVGAEYREALVVKICAKLAPILGDYQKAQYYEQLYALIKAEKGFRTNVPTTRGN